LNHGTSDIGALPLDMAVFINEM